MKREFDRALGESGVLKLGEKKFGILWKWKSGKIFQELHDEGFDTIQDAFSKIKSWDNQSTLDALIVELEFDKYKTFDNRLFVIAYNFNYDGQCFGCTLCMNEEEAKNVFGQ